MGEWTGISWTDKTWNPWHGCARVSRGCDNCYMFTEKRMYGQDPEQVVRSKTTFGAPLKWPEPARVFTCSWSDFFIKEADPWRDEAWAIIRSTPHLTYQILTKRPARIARHLPPDWPLPNVWLGVTVESRQYLHRIDVLREIPAAVRFVSFEPLLEDPGGINLSGIHWAIWGFESGPHARPGHLSWLRHGLAQCWVQRCTPYVKQLGRHPLDLIERTSEPLHFHDPKGANPAEWPEDLRGPDGRGIRQFPDPQVVPA